MLSYWKFDGWLISLVSLCLVLIHVTADVMAAVLSLIRMVEKFILYSEFPEFCNSSMAKY